jgi:TPR repeat protein
MGRGLYLAERIERVRRSDALAQASTRGPYVLGLLAALGGVFGCGPGTVGRALRPGDPKASDALGEKACRSTKGGGEPLVVDLQAHERADLEEAMQGGVAVVAWDCQSLRLLRDCRADGSYAFHGLSPQEFTVKLEDADEVKANLPTFGVKILSSFEAEMSRGASIDLAVSMIGKRRTTVTSLEIADLQGPCSGATHYVRGVYLGAFAMTTGTKGRVRGAADIFGASVGAGSSSSKLAENRDGDLAACRSASSSATAPPEKCASLLRLELSPIGGAAGTKGGDKSAVLTSSADVCPEGMVLVEGEGGGRSGGKCALPGERPFQCHADRPVECADQCGRGHAGSCATMGFLYASGRGVPKDPAQAVSFFQKSCDKKDALGCTNLGVLLERGEGSAKDPARAVGLYKDACDAGQMLGCYDLALVYDLGRGVTADPARATALYRRACDGGEPDACASLAVATEAGSVGTSGGVAAAAKLYEKACQGDSALGCYDLGLLFEAGKGTSADPAKAFALFSSACQQGLGFGCAKAADAYERGVGAAKDPSKALEMLDLGCQRGAPSACGDLGLAYEEGQGVAKDLAKAASLYKVACEGGALAGCVNWGIALEGGRGVAKDVVKAAQIYDAVCKKGEALACVNLGGLLSFGHGVPKDDERAAQLYDQGCKGGAASGCAELGAFVETGGGGQKKDKGEAVRLYRQGCAGGSDRACKALDRLGVPRGP